MLDADDLSQPIPVDAEQLFYLIDRKHVDYPALSKEEIEDKSKTDSVARFATLRPITGL